MVLDNVIQERILWPPSNPTHWVGSNLVGFTLAARLNIPASDDITINLTDALFSSVLPIERRGGASVLAIIERGDDG
jgi:hypothetical protein